MEIKGSAVSGLLSQPEVSAVEFAASRQMGGGVAASELIRLIGTSSGRSDSTLGTSTSSTARGSSATRGASATRCGWTAPGGSTSGSLVPEISTRRAKHRLRRLRNVGGVVLRRRFKRTWLFTPGFSRLRLPALPAELPYWRH